MTIMGNVIRILTVIAALAWMSNVASATDYYVRPHVTDGKCSYPDVGGCDGTSYATAWEGTTAASGDGTPVNWTTVDTGDGKLFVAGTHNERINVGGTGEVGFPIQIVSCTIANGASIDDPGTIDMNQLATANSHCVQITTRYVTLDGLTLTDSQYHGIYVTGSPGDVEIKNCTIFDNGDDDGANDDGIRIDGGTLFNS